MELETIVQNPSLKLIDMLVSFDVYLDEPGFSKKLVKGTLPVSYIAIR